MADGDLYLGSVPVGGGGTGEAGLIGRLLPTAYVSTAISSGTYARVDNAWHVAFTGPDSGWVLVHQRATMTTSGNSLGQWRLQDAAGTAVTNSDTGIRFANGVSHAAEVWLLLAVTPGDSYDWYWAHARGYGSSITTSSAGQHAIVGGGEVAGGMIFDVYDADTFALAHGRRIASGNFTGDSGIDLTFVAPESGCVDFWASGWCGDGSNTYAEVRISTTPGSRYRTDTYVYIHSATGRSRSGGRCRIGGLTPGQSYTFDVWVNGANCQPGNFGVSQFCTFMTEVPAA